MRGSIFITASCTAGYASGSGAASSFARFSRPPLIVMAGLASRLPASSRYTSPRSPASLRRCVPGSASRPRAVRMLAECTLHRASGMSLALGIAVSRQVALGLVEQHVCLGGRAQRLAVQGNAIILQVDPVVGILHYFSVHANTPRPNPASRVRSRAGASLGKHSFQGLYLFVAGWRCLFGHGNGTVSGPSTNVTV